MANQWFRMYSEFAFDPKVQVLTEALQRRYVMLLCLHCDNKYKNRPIDEIALSLRVTVEDAEKTIIELKQRGLIDKDGNIHGWDKRQYISDITDPTAAQRQKVYRERKRNALRDVTDSNGSVTERYGSVTGALHNIPRNGKLDNQTISNENNNISSVTNKRNVTPPLRPDTDTDTDTEKNNTIGRMNGHSRFNDWWSEYPKKVKKQESLKVWKSRHLDESADELIEDAKDRKVHDQRWLDGFVPDPPTYLRGKRWEDHYPEKKR